MWNLPSLVTALLCFVQQGPGPSRSAVPERDRPDDEVNAFLREQGLDHSEVMQHLSWMCDVHGPRLTGSPNMRRAQEWAVRQYTEWGITTAHLEEWGPFGRGWQLDHFHMDVTGENPWPVLAWPKAWSPSSDGIVEGDAVLVGDMSAEALAALDLTGKIVLLEGAREVTEPFEARAKKYDAESLLNLADGRRPPRTGAAPTPEGRPQADGAPPPADPNRPPAAQGDTPPAAAPGGPPAAPVQPPGPDSSNFRSSFQRRSQTLRTIYAKKPLAILDRGSKGDYGSIFVQSASVPSPEPAPGEDPRAQRGRGPRVWSPEVTGVIPQCTVAVEHYNRMVRMLEKGVPVHLSFRLDAKFFDETPMEHNVVAEIPGSDPEKGSETVMLGAHYDSWHSATGATDNGAGSAVTMEVMRLLSKLATEKGKAPRRTIRAALWSGEEEGLLGSRAYVEQHFGTREALKEEEHAKLSAYYNLDNGTGRIRGIYLQGNDACAPIFRSWFRPFHDLGASTLTLNNTGGTDHQSFDGVGLPGFQFIQDPVAYDTQTHHSNMDNWDHVIADDLKQAATIIASFVWHTAQRDELMPRKPRPPERTDRTEGQPTNPTEPATTTAPPPTSGGPGGQ